MFFLNKNKELQKMLEEYLGLVRETLDKFSESMTHVLKNGIDEHFHVLGTETHQKESNADDLRRDIEIQMYKKSLLPESRGDLLEVIEMIDRIPSQAELLLTMFHTQKTLLIDEIKDDMDELLKLSIETVDYTIKATNSCFSPDGKLTELSRLIDNNESVGDHLERKMVSAIFAKDMDSGEKLIQKDFVVQLGAICDICEKVKDKLTIVSIKRSV